MKANFSVRFYGHYQGSLTARHFKLPKNIEITLADCFIESRQFGSFKPGIEKIKFSLGGFDSKRQKYSKLTSSNLKDVN